jgi:CRISP-associated protein Cas1
MAILYVTEQGSKVQKVNERLVVSKNEQVLADVPLIKLERVVVMGRGVSVSTPLVHTLSRRGIGVVYLSGGGGYICEVNGQTHNLSQLRYRQALAIGNDEMAFAIARDIVRAKILNQRVLVQRHAERAVWAGRALAAMADMARRVDDAKSLDELRGYEGNAAREYFGIYRRLLKNPMGFERRAYFPPTDPVNAMLSFGYTLLLRDIVAACHIAGLDPALGFFHALDFGRPSMALDLEEAFRPVIVDSLVLGLVNHSQIGPQDFQQRDPRPQPENESENNGAAPKSEIPNPKSVYLTDAARPAFLKAYETRINTTVTVPQGDSELTQQTSYRRVLLLQAQAMARVILGESARFTPLRVR